MTPCDDGPYTFAIGDRVMFQWNVGVGSDNQDVGTVEDETKWGYRLPEGNLENPVLVLFDGDKTPEWVEARSIENI